ncbi:nitrilase-related carbon-nitrogen hydrolase [Oscillospiraceae bacterium MB08-C2-2]|nr:nitrilase-related carbon-nitrogen hydrolase [Oscillospiraceae bacterium MB08-C2-2]
MKFKVNIRSHQALLISYKLSTREVDKCIRRLDIRQSDNLSYTTQSDLRVSAVQLKLRKYEALWDYISDMNQYIEQAVNQRAQLVCFPEYAGLLPIFLIPSFSGLSASYKQEGRTPEWTAAFDDFLSYFSDFIFDVYFHTMSELAKLHGVFIMAGSSLYFEHTKLHHRAFLFNNSGDLVGCQDKMSLSPLEQDLQLQPATELKVFDTRLGAFSLLTGTDEQHPMLAQIAKKLGAQALLSPRSMQDSVPPSPLTSGLGLRVQENHLFGIQSSMTGDTGLGFSLNGDTRIYSPNELLKVKNGTIAKALSAGEGEIISARLDLEALSCLRNPYTQDRNRVLERKYLGKLP